MTLPVRPPLPPMEAKTVSRLPRRGPWQYEPKWDGFRCLVFKDGDEVYLQSKAEKPLGRYFPEVVEAVRALPVQRCVLDGELMALVHGVPDFDALLQRIHPAASRVKKLSVETPTELVVFDLLVDPAGGSLLGRPLSERRALLEAFAAKTLAGRPGFRLSPAGRDPDKAAAWLDAGAVGLDGAIAKRTDSPYLPGSRDAVVKVKRLRTADCVVGGFRYASKGHDVGSLLLGLYDADGLLHHVGYTSAIPTDVRGPMTRRLETLIAPPGFTGRAPGGPSRWSTERSTAWEPLRPDLVVEVQFDHVTGERFRHGTRLLRFRPDKAARQCTMDQLQVGPEAPLRALVERSDAALHASP